MKRKKKLTKDERLDLLLDKIVIGVKRSFQIFLDEAIRENRKLVIMREGKVVTVPAAELKHLKQRKFTSSRKGD
jgi:hypothetical protein